MSNIYESVLITGGGGMLAQALVRSLHERGLDAVALARSAFDIANSDQRLLTMLKHKPTLILNCAAYTKVDLCEKEVALAADVNTSAAAHLAAAAAHSGAVFMHFSTDFVFNGQASVPYKPTDPHAPLSTYGLSKSVGEQMVVKAGGEYVVLRTSWLYGPGGPNFVQTMLNAARTGKPLTVVDDQFGSPTFTHDLAEATLELIDRGARGVYHATNSGETTWFEFAKAIFEEFGVSKVDLKPISSAKWKAMRPDSAVRPRYSVLDCSETEKLIGRQMPHWRDALHRYRLAIEAKRD